MCIKCIQNYYPNKKITYRNYKGPRIFMMDFKGRDFPGWSPHFIDLSLVGLYRVNKGIK